MVAKNARLIEGPVKKTLIRLTLPMIFGTFSMVIFNLTDTFFLGLLGTEQLAALSFTFPVVLIVNSLSHGVALGASAVISHAIGEGNHNKVKRLTTDSFVLSIIFAGIFIAIGLLTVDPLFHLLGASAEVMPYIRQYMTIWYTGVFFVVIPAVGTNAIRATGNTKTPAFIMMFAAIANIILDPVLIFGIGPFPRLEVAGAATATVIARASTLIVSLIIIHHQERMLTFEIPSLKSIIDSWKQVLYIGLPNAGTMIIVPLATGVITSIVAAYGSEAVAGFGVATRIEVFATMVNMSLAAVTGTFVGQNWGAGKFDRIESGIKHSYRFSLIWGLITVIALAFLGSSIGSIFSNDPGVVSVTGLYLLIVPIGYGLYGVFVIATSAMNVLKKPIHAAALTLTQTFILCIPLAYLGSFLFGLWGAFIALPISYFISGVTAYCVLNRIVTNRETSMVIDNSKLNTA